MKRNSFYLQKFYKFQKSKNFVWAFLKSLSILCNISVYLCHNCHGVFVITAKEAIEGLFNEVHVYAVEFFWGIHQMSNELPITNLQHLKRFLLIRSVLRASNLLCIKFIEIVVILWVYYTIPFGCTLFWPFLASLLIFKFLCLAKDHWWGFSTRNARMVHIINLIRFKMV